MKKIKICNVDYNIDANALTGIQYRKKFNRGIREDIVVLKDSLNKQLIAATQLKVENPEVDDKIILDKLSGLIIDDIDLFIEAATRIAYILIYTANPEIDEYEDWLKSIPKIKSNDEWIAEVAEVAADCFC